MYGRTKEMWLFRNLVVSFTLLCFIPILAASENDSAVFQAANAGKTQLVAYLLKKGVNINALNEENWNLLHVASRKGHVDLAKLLLGSSPPIHINAQTNTGWTALLMAVYINHSDLVRLLIQKGANLDLYNQERWTAFHIAAKAGNVEILEELLKKSKQPRSSINSQNTQDWIPLHLACMENHLSVISFLIQKGSELNTASITGWTPLHVATAQSHPQAVKTLLSLGLQRGLDMDNKDADGWTALHIAAYQGDSDIVKILLEKGARLALLNKEGYNALHVAASRGHANVISTFLDRKSQFIDERIPDKSTALHLAVSSGHLAVANTLLLRGAKIHAENEKGWTPLHQAVYRGDQKIVELFLQRAVEKGLDIANHQSKDGRTALHLAASLGREEIVDQLLAKGALQTTRDAKGLRAYDYAKENGFDKIAQALKPKEAD